MNRMNSAPRKFRVAVQDEDGWTVHKPPHKFALGGSEGCVFDICEGDLRVVDAEVMFPTGHTDAEGNEIWWGDIARFSIRGSTVVREVTQHNIWKAKNGVVIGDRYRTPELLEQTAEA